MIAGRRHARRGVQLGAAPLLLALALGCGQPAPTGTPVVTPSPTPVIETPAPPATPRIGSFKFAAFMTTNRISATATLLADGRVLIAGGKANGKRVATAEIYDPDTGAFTATGSMTEPRAGQTATLLGSGLVLIAGGSADNTAELYNPATGLFFRTGTMQNSAILQTATRLNDGRVLLAGGFDGAFFTTSAQFYKPSTGRFTRAKSLRDPREDADAVLLQDGRVLVMGGDQGNKGKNAVILASVEIFNPSNGYFTEMKPMADARSHFAATVLQDGRVLVIGGLSTTTTGKTRLLNTAEIYNPASGRWSSTGSMTYGRSDFTATLLADGRVLVAGGGDNTTEIYYPSTATFIPGPPMVMARALQTATLLNDTRVLFAGGNEANLGEIYTP